MTERGITLIELLVVISIIAILAVALGFSFEGWLGKYHVEGATRQLYADLEDARARAVQGTDDYLVKIDTAGASRMSYTIMQDTNENGTADDTPLRSFPKTIQYGTAAYDANNAAVALPLTLIFSKRGMMSPEETVVNIVSDNDADYNCTKIDATRIGMGKMVCSNNGAICKSNADCGGGTCTVCQVR